MKYIILSILIFIFKVISQSMENHFHTNLGDLYPDPMIAIKYQEDWQRDFYLKRIAQFKKMPIGFNKIVFLGNSITEGGNDWNKRFGVNNIVNRGISGDITEGILSRLDEIIYYKPTAIFLLIGINDIFDNQPDKKNINSSQVAKNIIQIAENIQKDSRNTKIFIQTILPVDIQKHMNYNDRSLSSYNSEMVNQIIAINRLIIGQNNFPVIDLHSAFVDERGLMNKAYTTDGVHLNDIGYKAWVKYVNNYVQ
ncbi:MAG: GDSL-type esterase/lipase family protein [Candidatus Neomarinimicrobiota bacterium]|nr:GDSL-type esterase/lipase family protein [Candidatus Neomarinimicrobiota bacterium]|tara:strand:+ start:7440 stop:8195 length:756 start_codon:yes stop_codon:yes gene_type:complete